MALKFLNNEIFYKNINPTFIVLIPKTNCPIKLNEYKPISLYNVIYKVISKTIANRLKPIISSIIFKSQSVFILERLITNNIIVTYKALHTMKTRKKGSNGIWPYKLIYSKHMIELNGFF